LIPDKFACKNLIVEPADLRQSILIENCHDNSLYSVGKPHPCGSMVSCCIFILPNKSRRSNGPNNI
jgi:hypothetical protein